MNKLTQLKQSMQNPPPERLAKIEYKSHFLQIIGITVVCIALVLKGFWYIIFAFIFSVGISYSQGMTAYRKYKTIMSIVAPEKMEDYEKDISPTRRRSKIINSVIPQGNWLGIISSVILTMITIDPTIGRIKLMILYPLTIFIYYVVVYFFVLYWITHPIYKSRIKLEGGRKDAKEKTTRN